MFFEAVSHIVQASLKFIVLLRITLNFFIN